VGGGGWGVKGKKKKPTDLPQRRSARLAAREEGPSSSILPEPTPFSALLTFLLHFLYILLHPFLSWVNFLMKWQFLKHLGKAGLLAMETQIIMRSKFSKGVSLPWKVTLHQMMK
jgi:hypothetical protein